MNYVVAEAVPPKGVCRLEGLENVAEWAEMQKGTSQRNKFPADAYFQMHEDFPKDVKFADALFNLNSFLVVSKKLLDLLTTLKALTRNDVHEVAILDHKRREKATYHIVHQFAFPKCVDAARTVGRKSALNPVEYISVKKLVLDEAKLDDRVAIFRPREYNDRAFFRRDVADEITAAGLTGLEFYEIDEYENF